MAAKDKKNFNESIERISDQFQNLDMRDPGLWPAIPRYALCLLVVVLTAAVVWFFFVQDAMAELDAARQKEETLRQEYKNSKRKVLLEKVLILTLRPSIFTDPIPGSLPVLTVPLI